MKTVALIPVYNEEEHILAVLADLEGLVDLILILDDGSTDSTPEKLDRWVDGREHVTAFRTPTNVGKGQALRFGFQEVERLRREGKVGTDDVVVNVDADGQHVLQDIPRMVERLREGGFDVVLARRDLTGYPALKRLGNRVLSGFARLLTGFPYQDCESGLRCMRVSVLDEVLKYYTGFRYSDSQELAIITALKGHRIDNAYPSKIHYYKPEGPTLWDACYILGFGLLAALRARMGLERKPGAAPPPYRRKAE